jgi:RNA polymerase sigma-70 factor (ECF subfamily)
MSAGSPLDELLEQAAAAWPGVSVPRAELLAYLAERLPPDRTLEEAAASLPLIDLHLACACARSEPGALEAFDAAFRDEIDRAFARVRPGGLTVDDARQVVRQKLFVGAGGRGPRIRDYAGRGALRAWVRMTAIRTLIDLAREHGDRAHDVPLDDVLSFEGTGGDTPDRALLVGQCRAELRPAFEEAVAELTPRQRNLLRQHFLHALTIDQLAGLYGAHRSTCARWLDAAREKLVRGTRRRLAERLGVPPGELDEIMQLVASRLDITFRRVLGDPMSAG